MEWDGTGERCNKITQIGKHFDNRRIRLQDHHVAHLLTGSRQKRIGPGLAAKHFWS